MQFSVTINISKVNLHNLVTYEILKKTQNIFTFLLRVISTQNQLTLSY